MTEFLLAWAGFSGYALVQVLYMNNKLPVWLYVPLLAALSFGAPQLFLNAVGSRMRENGHISGDMTGAVVFMGFILFVLAFVGPRLYHRVLYEGIEEESPWHRPKK